jgi:hypothetical protein
VPGTKDTDTALEAAEKCMMEDVIKEVLTNSESSRSGCASRPVGSRGGVVIREARLRQLQALGYPFSTLPMPRRRAAFLLTTDHWCPELGLPAPDA